VTGLPELPRRIAARIRHVGSPADIEREIIAGSSLDDEQLPSLRVYARGLLRALARENALLASEGGRVR
jgi:hypothetical protein